MKTKVLLLFAICFCVVFASNAQLNTGTYLTGGSFYINNTKYSQPSPQSKNESLNVNIQFGKVVKENTVVGVLLTYGYSNYHDINVPDSNFNKSNQYSAGVFYRKYKKLAKDFYFFGEVDAAYTHADNTQENSFQNESNGLKSFSDGGSCLLSPVYLMLYVKGCS